jgi:hypothetical protein
MGNTICSETNYSGDYFPVGTISDYRFSGSRDGVATMPDGISSSPDGRIKQPAATINSSFYPHYTCSGGTQQDINLKSCYQRADVVSCTPKTQVDGIRIESPSGESFTIGCCIHPQYDGKTVASASDNAASSTGIAPSLYGLYQEDALSGKFNALATSTRKATIGTHVHSQVGVSEANALTDNSTGYDSKDNTLKCGSLASGESIPPSKDDPVTIYSPGSTSMITPASVDFPVFVNASEWSPNTFYNGKQVNGADYSSSSSSSKQNMIYPLINNLPYVGCCESITASSSDLGVIYFDSTVTHVTAGGESVIRSNDGTEYQSCGTTLGDPMTSPNTGCAITDTGIIIPPNFCENIVAKSPACTSAWTTPNPPPLVPVCIRSNPKTITSSNPSGSCSFKPV